MLLLLLLDVWPHRHMIAFPQRRPAREASSSLTLPPIPLSARHEAGFAALHPSETVAEGFPLNLQPRRGQRFSRPVQVRRSGLAFQGALLPHHNGLARGASAPRTT